MDELPAVRKNIIKQLSCFVAGTTIERDALNDAEIVLTYKNQNTAVEREFRFLKDSLMFTSSLFVKKNQRIMGLLMVMTLALLVYAVAQRRLHKTLEKIQKTLPNQIRKETATPTLRWIFQLLDRHNSNTLSPLNREEKSNCFLLGVFGQSINLNHEAVF